MEDRNKSLSYIGLAMFFWICIWRIWGRNFKFWISNAFCVDEKFHFAIWVISGLQAVSNNLGTKVPFWYNKLFHLLPTWQSTPFSKLLTIIESSLGYSRGRPSSRYHDGLDADHVLDVCSPWLWKLTFWVERNVADVHWSWIFASETGY